MTESQHEASLDDLPAPPAELEGGADLDPRLRRAFEEVGELRARVEKERKKRKKAEKKVEGKGSLGTSRGVETMFRTAYQTQMSLFQLADNKANIMISINGIMISIILASISPRIDASPWLLGPSVVLLLGSLTSMFYAVLAARPRVDTRAATLDAVREGRANILFFGHFVQLGEDDYLDGMVELLRDNDRLYTALIRDIYSLGGLLLKKYRLLRVSYVAFIAAVGTGVLLFIAVFTAVALFGMGVPQPLP